MPVDTYETLCDTLDERFVLHPSILQNYVL